MREIHAKLPHVRLADPDSAATAIEIATLRAIAEPFRAPPAVIRDLAAIVRLTDDSITIRDARIALPGSRINGYSAVARGGSAQVRARAEPVMFADLRWLYPGLPSEGGGSLDFAFVSDSGYSDFTASGIDLRSGGSALAGSAGVRVSDSTEIHDTDLRFSDVGTRLIEMLAPGVDVPLSGTLSGRAELAGTIRALRVDGDVTFRDARFGTSRLVATGEIGFGNGFRARDLRVRAMPLRMNLVRALGNPLPIGGAVTGRATIDGAVGSAWRIDGDVTHLDRGERSRVTGRARVTSGRQKTIDAYVRALPLSLTTVGRFAPRVGARDVRSVEDLSFTLNEAGVGSTIDFTVWRALEPSPLTLSVHLKGARNPALATAIAEESGGDAATPQPKHRRSASLQGFGLQVIGLTARIASRLGAKGGLLVVAVRPESLAAACGLRAGDVIENVHGAAFALRDLNRTLSARGAQPASLGIVREGSRLTLSLPHSAGVEP
ncbi:MAG: hypothetical protein H7Z38_01950 [Rubrivivax sp.]|nr:hypothetical protein [Pyrinomonadaceae bacterium]